MQITIYFIDYMKYLLVRWLCRQCWCEYSAVSVNDSEGQHHSRMTRNTVWSKWWTSKAHNCIKSIELLMNSFHFFFFFLDDMIWLTCGIMIWWEWWELYGRLVWCNLPVYCRRRVIDSHRNRRWPISLDRWSMGLHVSIDRNYFRMNHLIRMLNVSDGSVYANDPVPYKLYDSSVSPPQREQNENNYFRSFYKIHWTHSNTVE